MNVISIGSTPGAAPGVSATGATADQGFSDALGLLAGLVTPSVQTGVTRPMVLGAQPMPLRAGTADPALPAVQPTQEPALTLAQLLTTDSPAPAAPAAPAANIVVAPAANDVVPAAANDVVPATTLSGDAATASVDTGKIAATTDTMVACPTATDTQPDTLDLPELLAPPKSIVATPTVVTPVKTRKSPAVEADATPPSDPLTAQTATAGGTSIDAVMQILAQIQQPQQIPQAKVATTASTSTASAPTNGDASRAVAAKPVAAPLAASQASAAPAIVANRVEPRSNSDDEASADGSSSNARDIATPIAAKLDTKAALPAAQSFAAQVAAPSQDNAVTATSKTVTAEPVLTARPGQLGQSMGVEIARKVDAGEDTLRVRLNPAELGRVEVTLKFDDSGNIRATMRAESPHALELLRQDAPDLGRALDSAGIRSDAQSFRFESRSDGNTNAGNGTGGQASQQQSRQGGQQHAFDKEAETGAPAYRAIRADGQVDLLA